MDLLENLNHQQRQAVEVGDQSLAIIAGPGTGKTKTLTTRIAYLLRTRGLLPEQILAVTFTNKVAREMRQRASVLLGDNKLPVITTFHAYCYQLLQEHGTVFDAFLTDAERLAILRELSKPTALQELQAREIGLLLSRYKNAVDGSSFDSAVKQVAAEYDAVLTERGLQDFDNLLQQTYQLLITNVTLRERIQQQYRHVLVDEFQDTNELQYEMLRLIVGSNHLTAIGDPRQSIYSFRGADSDLFERFINDFPTAQTIVLTTNYRSTQTIVRFANNIFPNETPLAAHQKADGQVRIIKTLNEHAEAAFVVSAIEQQLGGTTLLTAQADDGQAHHFRDFAVLYRTHRTARAMQRSLEASGIPYQIVGDESPYASPLIAALSALLIALCEAEPLTERQYASLSALKSMTHAMVVEQLEQCRSMIGRETVVALVNELIKRCRLATVADKKQAAMQQYTNFLFRFGTDLKAATVTLQALQQADSYDAMADAVTLLTIHAAKGLEFNHVFLCGAEEGVLPHGRKGTDVDEEQRLFYVAATRAKQQLDILYAKTRAHQPAEPSRFIAKLSHQDDPAMAVQEKRHHKQQLKRRQASLF